MDVTFVEEAEKKLQKVIEEFSKNVIDYGPQLLSAGDRLRQAEQAHELAVVTADAFPRTFTTRLPKLRELAGLNLRRQDAARTLKAAEIDDAGLDADVAAMAGKLPDPAAAKARREALGKELLSISAGLAQLTRMRDLQQRLEGARAETAALAKEVLLLSPKAVTGGHEARVKELETLLLDRKTRLGYAEAKAKSLADLLEKKRQLALLVEAGAATPSVEVAAAAEAEVQAKVNNHHYFLGLLRAFEPGHADCGCPLCGSAVPPSAEYVTERRKAIERDMLEDSAVLKTRMAQTVASRAHARSVALAEAAVAEATKALAGFQETADDAAALRDEVAKLDEEMRVATGALREANAVAQTLAGKKTRLTSLRESVATLESDLAGINIGDDAAALEARKTDVLREAGQLDILLREAALLNARVQNRSGLVPLRAEFDRLQAATEEGFADANLAFDDEAALAGLISVLAEDERKAVALDTERAAAAKLCATIRAEIDAIQRKIEASARERKRLEKLREFRDAIGRNGATGAYLRDVFHKVLAASQKYLLMMNSPLAVFTDPEDPFAIVFRDLTNDTARPLAQSKLSGAQKVRLSLSFLFALHELIVPELGFVSLDEPSCHLSAETGVSEIGRAS